VSQRDLKSVKYASYASVAVACVLIIIKLFAWQMTGALSLQASLIDSLLDGVASLLNMVAIRQALRPPDAEHRFGHGKIEAIGALAQSIFIFGSAGWLLYEAVNRFVHPHLLEEAETGLWVMGFSIALTLGLVLYQKAVFKRTNSIAIHADSIHYQSDLFINIGVIIALLGSTFKGMVFLDPLIGAGIATYILYTAWKVAAQSFDILIDREFSQEERQKIIHLVLSHPQVLGYHDLRTRSSGTQKFIQIHLEMDGNLTLKAVHKISLEVILKLRQAFPHTEVLIHEDPSGEIDEHP
jgi:ferrous-iron efflux pump FieF